MRLLPKTQLPPSNMNTSQQCPRTPCHYLHLQERPTNTYEQIPVHLFRHNIHIPSALLPLLDSPPLPRLRLPDQVIDTARITHTC